MTLAVGPAVDLLLTGGMLLTRAGVEPVASSHLAVAGGRILAAGPLAELPPDIRQRARRHIDVTGKLLMPGLVNGHCHAAMTLFRGMADDLPLLTWLQEHIFPAEARHVRPEMVYWCSKLAAAEMLLSGTTLVADGYFFEGDAARAFAECGIRAVAAQGVIDFPAPGVDDPSRNLLVAQAHLDRWVGHDPLVTPSVFCHSPYTCSAATITASRALARSYGVPWCIHLAETAHEARTCRQEHGVSPVRYLAGLGVLDPGAVCVHCVHLDDEDIAVMRESGAGVISCPESNMKLASGTAHLTAMAGMPVGLGTDGAASNNDLDMFGEMGSCARLHKVAKGDPAVMPAAAVLGMATVGGAAVFGMGGALGALAPGYLADFLVIDLDRPHLTPWHGPDLLVYAARGGDVEAVYVGGRAVVENRRLVTIDLGETMARVRELARGLKR
ncbi:MAG: amidohydrolase [Thermodesulfobacteriota bacterium]